MKVTIELNREEFGTALDTGALKALSTALERTGSEDIKSEHLTQTVSSAAPAPTPAPTPVHPAPAAINPGQAPVYPQQPVPVQTSMPMPNQPAVPTTPQASYTMEQLAVAATQLMDAGKRNDLIGLLQSFGVQALTALPKEQYGAFATQLRAMGARI